MLLGHLLKVSHKLFFRVCRVFDQSLLHAKAAADVRYSGALVTQEASTMRSLPIPMKRAIWGFLKAGKLRWVQWSNVSRN